MLKDFRTSVVTYLMIFLPLFGCILAQDIGYESSCEQSLCCGSLFPPPNKFSIGPEIYYLRRTREGGTKQTGGMYGVRAIYDRIKRFRLYWGADVLYASGCLNGKSSIGNRLRSTFTDFEVEGRFGYTFQSKGDYQPSFTPFVGYGYFCETNKFRHPSPIKVKFDTYYRFYVVGFLSSLAINPSFTIGVNFKARFMVDAKCKIKNDPDFKNVTQLIDDKVNYRLEVPLSYYFCPENKKFGLDLIPFFEYRHYGRRENYPFDFLDTKIRIYGGSFLLTYHI
jgi:hypothetical protein